MAVLEKHLPAVRPSQRFASTKEPLAGAFFWLSAFYVAYCARPTDWIPGFANVPVVKISGIFALIALLMSAGRSRRRLRDLPREAIYFLAIICLLFVSALVNPIWKGGAFFGTLDFSKALVAWVLIYLVITSFTRLRRLIFIQSASVAVITLVSVVKGRSHPRLQGVLGGIYSNPNDLAFAIVLSLPFALMFLLQGQGLLRRLAWALALLVMAGALVLTGSRAGFIQLVIAGSVCLWHFGVKGRRSMLLVKTFLVGAALLIGAGGKIKSRFMAISGDINSG